MVSLAIIVPTYNEAENVSLLMGRIRASLGSTISYNVLVMDDSPGDETVRAAIEAGCKAVHRTKNRGLSPAVIEGIDIAKLWKSDYVIVMDADLQHPPEVLPAVLEALKDHDFVIPSRYIKGGGCKGWSSTRKFISRVANLLAMPLAKFKVKDLSSGFFGFRTTSLQTTETLKAKGFKIMLELLVKGNWQSIKEIPYVFETRKHGESKLSQANMVAYLHQLLDLYLYKFRWLRFGLVGIAGMAINFPVLYALTELAHLSYMISAVVAVLCASTSNYFLNHLWTFKERHTNHNYWKGWVKYQMMSGMTDSLYLVLLATLTEVAGVWYMLSAAVALVMVFVSKYLIASRLIWRTHKVSQAVTTSDYYTHVEKYDWVTDPKYPEKLLHTLRAKHVVGLVKKYATHTSVLDLGCGTGLITKDLPGKVFGMDLNPWNIERARNHCPNAVLMVGDAEQPLPFSPDTFDVVVCTDMLEHVDHPEQVVRNAAKVLMHGGYLVGEVPSNCPIWKFRKVLSRTCPAEEPFHRNYNFKEVRELLKDFQVISIQYSSLFMEVSFVARKA